MQVSSLELCATSVLVRAFTEDSSSTGVNKIVDEISKNRSLDPCLEIILKRIVNTQPANLTDRLLCVLLSGGIHLKSLELRKCTNISLVGLAMALKCQPCIEYLDLSECNQLTHASIADILAKGAPVLKSLIFESCYNMKDPTVQAILRSCNKLTFIGLACSPFLTDDVLFFGSKDAMHPSNISLSLTGIDMSGCKTVSETTVRQLAVLCGPNLKSVNISWTNIDCIALVYLSGYSLSSAVFLATNAHHEDVPFTVAELEATQQFELQMIQKHTAVDSEISKEHLTRDAEPLGMQKVDTSIIVNAESDIWEKERSYEERPEISQETNAECSAPENAIDYITKDHKQCSVESVPISKEDIFPAKCEETDAVFLSQFVDAHEDTFKSNTVLDSCADLDHTSSTARINLESDDIEFNTEDRPSKDMQIGSVNVLEIVQKTNSLELKANEAIIENNPEISNSPSSNTKHEMNSQFLCEAQIGISDTNAPYHTETATADSVTHSSNVESSNVLALANKLLANEITSTPLSLKDSQPSNPLTLSVSNESERSAIYVPRQMFNSQITELDISEIKFCDYEVGADCLKTFVSSNQCLRVFKISWKLLDDNLLGFIAQNEPELTNIGLVDCESLSNCGLKMLGEHCKKLSSVDLQGVPFVGDEGLHKILKNGSVSKLTLAECAVTDVTLRNIIKFSSPIITKLDLSWCENLTDHEISNFIRSCPHLEFLDLRQCDASVKTMDALCANGAGIDSLGLCSVQDITDKMTIPLSYTMKNLTFIDIGWNCMLTDETVTAIFKSCGLLVEVSLTGLKRITSQPFLPIISGLAEWRAKREVITTRLRRRGTVTRDLGLQEICEPDFYIPHRSVHYVPNLQKIDVSFSDKVNDIHLAEIVSVCRGTLRIEDYYSVSIKPRWRI